MSLPSLSEQAVAEVDPRPGDSSLPQGIGHFTVLGEIGRGGMGRVYVARDDHLDRRVALKLVSPEVSARHGRIAAQRRLLREAQAMARLAHPNVVQVFEAGEWRGDIWLAMELVEGGTLRTWLEAGDRDWRAILAMHLAAGRGLAAAHEAGLIHRDFKPDNVLVGADGRPRVADFGLVRPEGETGTYAAVPLDQVDTLDTSVADGNDTVSMHADGQPEHEGELEDDHGLDSWHASLDSTGFMAPLTRDGALLGTPRYMAPEQLLRIGADARSDQFAFCVVLYAALFGYPPFAGKTFFELAETVTLGQLQPPPRDTPVPRTVVHALLRGLSTSPDDRFPDMRSLLTALAPPEPKHRPRAILAGIAIVLAAVSVVVALALAAGDDAPALCTNGEARVASAWSEDRRAALRDRFSSAELGYAASTLDRIEDALDGWSNAWVWAYTDSCEATRVRGEQSDEALDLRMRCLDRNRREATAIVDVLIAADDQTISRASEVVEALPDVRACADVELLRRGIAPPPTGVADEVARLEDALARTESLIDARSMARAAELADGIEPAVLATDYRPLIARHQLAQGAIAQARRDGARASQLTFAAYTTALALDDDALALEAASKLILSDGSDRDSGVVLAERWMATVLALEARLQPGPRARVRARVDYGRVLARAFRPEEGIAQIREGLAIAEAAYGSEALETADIRMRLGAQLCEWGQRVEGERELERARAIVARELGPGHPRIAAQLRMLGMFATSAGEPDLAIERFEEALALMQAANGPDHPETIEVLNRLAAAQDMAGRTEQARASHEQVLELLGEREAPRSDNALDAANSLCFELYKLDELEQAREVCALALDGAITVRGTDSPFTGIVHNNLGLIARAEGDPVRALEHDRRALAIQEAGFGPDHPYTAYALVGIGESLLDLRRPKEGLPQLERALTIRENTGAPGPIGEARCLIGRSRAALGDARAAVDALDRAIAELDGAGPDWTRALAICTDARAQIPIR